MNRLAIALACLSLSACGTTYHLQADPNTGKITTLDIKSRREFENGLTVRYNRETGSFEFVAGSVSQGVSPLEVAAAGIVSSLPTLLGRPPVQQQE